MKKTIITLIALVLTLTALAQPKVPKTYTFAGQIVDLQKTDLYEKMDREIMAFTYTHSTSLLMLKRSGIYFPIIEPIIKEYGLPDDLKYIAVIESNMDPSLSSGAGAAGLWQLMPATAKEQGLEVNSNVDERYDVEKATHAACRILKASYAKFGDWMTVAAAYNAGQAGISRRLSDQGQESATGLWMATETTRYMFRLMAAKMMFEDPESFGFQISETDKYWRNPPKEVVSTTEAIPSLVNFAIIHGTTYSDLKRENLWLREDKLKNESGKTYVIVIPDYDL